MDIYLKQKALQQLVKTEGSAVQIALQKEGEKIASSLKSEAEYDIIKENLESLNIISYRIPGESLTIIESFLKRIEKLKLTYQPIIGIDESYLKKFKNKTS